MSVVAVHIAGSCLLVKSAFHLCIADCTQSLECRMVADVLIATKAIAMVSYHFDTVLSRSPGGRGQVRSGSTRCGGGGGANDQSRDNIIGTVGSSRNGSFR